MLFTVRCRFGPEIIRSAEADLDLSAIRSVDVPAGRRSAHWEFAHPARNRRTDGFQDLGRHRWHLHRRRHHGCRRRHPHRQSAHHVPACLRGRLDRGGAGGHPTRPECSRAARRHLALRLWHHPFHQRDRGEEDGGDRAVHHRRIPRHAVAARRGPSGWRLLAARVRTAVRPPLPHLRDR